MALSVASSSSVGPQQPWIRIPAPSGIQYGDLLVGFTLLDNDGSLSAMGAPSDWYQLTSLGNRNNGFVKAWYKWASWGEPSNYTFGGASGADGLGAILRITGISDPNKISLWADLSMSFNTSGHASPSELIYDTDSLYIGMWGGIVFTTATWTLPGGFTNQGLSLIQNAYTEMVTASKTGAAGSNGPFTATSSAWNGLGFGDITGAIIISQSATGVASASLSATAKMTATATVSGAPGIFPTISVKHLIDWAGNGNYSDTGDDVSKRVLATDTITIAKGRDQSRALSPTKPGSLTGLALDNTSRDYSPDNATSPLTGKITPARPYKIVVTWLSVDYTVWLGHLDDYNVDPTPGSQRVSATAVDALSDMQGEVRTELFQGIRSGDAINLILDAIGWPTALRDIDPGVSVFRFWWEDGTNAWDALQKVVNSEGPPALITIDYNTGKFVFRDRSHRAIYTNSTTVQATYRNAGTDPRFSWPLGYSVGWKDVINNVTFTVNERGLSNPGIVWSTDAQFTLTANQVASIIVTAQEPFVNAIVPKVGTDFVLAFGSVDVSIGQTSGQSTLLTITETGGGTAIVQGMALRANSVPVQRTYTVQSIDSASQGSYGVRSYPLQAEWASRDDAQAIADAVISMRAQRLPTVSVRFMGGTNAIMTEQLSRALSDRVHVTDSSLTGTGLDADFYVEQIQHTIRGAGNKILETVVGCEKVGAQIDIPSTVFRFGIDPNGKFGTGLFGH